MNYPFTLSGQVPAAADLAEAVADRYGCVGVISRSAIGTAALLDQTAHELSSRRIRCVRVQGRASGGLASRDLIAQIVARPDPGALSDADLKAGFMALTEPGEGYKRVALLVSEAHSLLPSALRYIQLARQSTPAKLCLVLAGQPGLLATLEGEDFAALRSAVHTIEVAEPAGHELFDKASAISALPLAPRGRGGSAPLVRLGLAAMIVPVVGLIWWRHLPPSSTEAVPSLDAPSVPPALVAPNVPSGVGAPDAVEPPVPPAAEPPAAAPVARAEAPVPSAPSPAPPPQAEDGLSAEPVPPPAALPSPPVAEAEPEPVQNSVSEAAPPPAAELPAAAAEPSTPPADEPPATPERSEAPTGKANAAAEPAPPKPAPEAGPPPPDPAPETKPPASPPHGSVTVTAAPPAHGGARRTVPVPPASAPPVSAPAATPAHAVEQPSLADARRCRDIVLKAQLGQNPSDDDKQFLRSGCRNS